MSSTISTNGSEVTASRHRSSIAPANGLTTAVHAEAVRAEAAATQRVKDVEQKAAWILAFTGPVVALLLTAMHNVLGGSGVGFEGHPRLWGVVATCFVLALFATTVAAVFAASALWLATYVTHAAGDVLAAADRHLSGENPADEFLIDMSAAHRRRADSASGHGDRKARRLRVALGAMVVPVIVLPVVGVLYLIALGS